MKKLYIPLLAGLFLSGCAYVSQVNRLPAYDYAMQMDAPKRPKIFYADTVKLTSSFTEYAVIVATSPGNNSASETSLLRNIWWKATDLKADVVLVKKGGSQFAGAAAASMPVGNGAMAFAVPAYETIMYGYCLRLNPSKIGYKMDTSNMIIEITNDSLREAGILEGDKIIAVNGASVTAQMPEALKLKPNQAVSVTVIRPGTGKLEKTIKTMDNLATYLDYSDAVTWEDKPVLRDQP